MHGPIEYVIYLALILRIKETLLFMIFYVNQDTVNNTLFFLRQMNHFQVQ